MIQIGILDKIAEKILGSEGYDEYDASIDLSDGCVGEEIEEDIPC